MTSEYEQRVDRGLEENRLAAVRSLGRYLKTPQESILREHQEDVMDSLYRFFRQGGTSGYISLPSGSGKTVLAAEIARVLGRKTLIVSPTQTILTQTDRTVSELAPGVSGSLYFSKEKDLSGQVVNTTYQSLVALLKTDTFHPDDYSLLLLDEAHLGLGELRHTIYRKFPRALKIGLTATPFFTPLAGYEDRGMVKPSEPWVDLFTRSIHEMTMEEGIERGVLSHVALYLLRTNVEVPRLKLTQLRTYDPREMERYLNSETRNVLTLGMVAGTVAIPKDIRLSRTQREEIESIRGMIAGKRTAIFGLSIAHIEDLTRRLHGLGIAAEAVHSRVPYERRRAILEDHASGATQVVLGVDALRIGWDSPATQVGIYLEPHRSGILAVQEFGRILRPSPGKERAIAIQLVDDFRDRSQAPILFSDLFDPEMILRGTQTGRPPSRGQAKERQPLAPITLSGTEISAIIDSARSQALLQTRFNQATVSETASLIADLAQEIQCSHPNVSTLELYHRIADTLPQKVALEKQRQALQALASLDTNTAKRGRDVFLLLNMKSLLSAVESYLGDDPVENDEIVSAAVSAVVEKLMDIKPYEQPTQWVYLLSELGAQRYIASRDSVPWSWVRDGRYKEAQAQVKKALSAYPKGMSEKSARVVSATISQKTGVPARSLKRYLLHQSFFRMYEQKGEEDLLHEAAKGQLRSEIAAARGKLTERQQRVLDLRFGLIDGQQRTLVEVGDILGLSKDRIRQIEGEALRHLRHPLRSRGLKDFIE